MPRGDWRTNVPAYTDSSLGSLCSSLTTELDKLNINSYSLVETRFASSQTYIHIVIHQTTLELFSTLRLFESLCALLFFCTFYPIYQIHHSNFMLHRSNT